MITKSWKAITFVFGYCKTTYIYKKPKHIIRKYFCAITLLSPNKIPDLYTVYSAALYHRLKNCHFSSPSCSHYTEFNPATAHKVPKDLDHQSSIGLTYMYLKKHHLIKRSNCKYSFLSARAVIAKVCSGENPTARHACKLKIKVGWAFVG